MLQLLETMLRIRSFELRISELFARNQVRGTAHLSVGQEAIPTGTCAVLERADLVVATHRGHGAALAKGLEPYRLFAEILGRREGYCAGRGGSQHLSCIELGFLGTNGITGGGLPLATGAALALKRRATRNVVVAFFGEGAANKGTFYEALNLASIWQLPIIYVCENNQYAVSARSEDSVAGKSIAERAEAYDMAHETVDGNDVHAVRTRLAEVVAAARAGRGPALVECHTHRQLGHSKSGTCACRTRAEEQAWRERDPITRLGKQLVCGGEVSGLQLNTLRACVRAEIDEAARQALQARAVTEEALYDDLQVPASC